MLLILMMLSIFKFFLLMSFILVGCDSNDITDSDFNFDCAGIENGNSVEDNCGVCDNDPSNLSPFTLC